MAEEKNNFEQKIPGTNITFHMIYVEGGSFMMGSEFGDAYVWEKSVQKVYLSDFYIADTVVSQELWKVIMGDNPSFFKGDKRPVEQVSWMDVKSFINKLNDLTGNKYRLPKEAEWEYAARGGNNYANHIFKYSGSNKLKEVGWYDNNSHFETKPIKLKSPNCLGLYDMSGNVFEWCEDKWFVDYESNHGNNIDSLDKDSLDRVLRGGYWWHGVRRCRVSYRAGNNINFRDSSTGFRLAL